MIFHRATNYRENESIVWSNGNEVEENKLNKSFVDYECQSVCCIEFNLQRLRSTGKFGASSTNNYRRASSSFSRIYLDSEDIKDILE